MNFKCLNIACLLLLEYCFLSCRVWIWWEKLTYPLDIILQDTVLRLKNPLGFTSCAMAFSLLPDAHLSFLLVRKKQWSNLLANLRACVSLRVDTEGKGGWGCPYTRYILFVWRFWLQRETVLTRMPKQCFLSFQDNVWWMYDELHFLNNWRCHQTIFFSFWSLPSRETLWIRMDFVLLLMSTENKCNKMAVKCSEVDIFKRRQNPTVFANLG